eukprot:8733681-Lingulodinium_polyedra.AAC.1
MQLNRPSAVAAVRALHVCALHGVPENWRARGVRERAICEPLRRRTLDSSTSSLCSVFERAFCARVSVWWRVWSVAR